MNNRDDRHREIANTLSGAAELLNEVRNQVNGALVRAEDRLQEILAANGDTIVMEESKTVVA